MDTIELVTLLATLTIIFSIVITALVKYLNADTASSVLSTLLHSMFVIDFSFKNSDSEETEEEKVKRKEEIENQLKIKHKDNLVAFSDTKELKLLTISRLKSYLADLNRKANLNLISGLTFCLLGLGFIFYSLIAYIPTDPPNINNTVTYFLPRITLTILIEVFSYFFLNLYRKNLEDIKYFQNEVTNLESKYLAIQYACESNNGHLKSKVIEKLMDTERNFILKKDETTIELEKNRIEAQSSSNTISALKDIISFKK